MLQIQRGETEQRWRCRSSCAVNDGYLLCFTSLCRTFCGWMCLNTYKDVVFFCSVTSQRPCRMQVGLLGLAAALSQPFTATQVMKSSPLFLMVSHSGTRLCNVIPHKWCSSHLGSCFELLAQQLLSARQKMGAEWERIVRHWFAVKKKKKIWTEDHFCAAREDQKLGWHRAGENGDAIAELSFHSQTSVKWLHLLRGHHYAPLYTYPPLLPPSFLLLSARWHLKA